MAALQTEMVVTLEEESRAILTRLITVLERLVTAMELPKGKDVTLWYMAGEDIRCGDYVSISAGGTICRYLAGVTLPAFAAATRNINAGEHISFSQDDDTDLRSRLTVDVLRG